MLLAAVRGVETRPGPVAVLRDDDDATVLDCGDRGDLIVFPWLDAVPRPDVDLMVALEAAGFNHVAAPLVRWTWEGSDLGVVQEPLADRSGGWALALTSLRDFYAAGGAPEAAGGDFGAEARALGHHDGPACTSPSTAPSSASTSRWWTGSTGPRRPSRRPTRRCWTRRAWPSWSSGSASPRHGCRSSAPTATSTWGGRRGRTRGGCVSDCSPGGVLAGESTVGRRTPLGDVADLLWSMHRASTVAAAERDPAGRLGLAALGQAWETRNRRAFVTGYLGHAGHRRAGRARPGPGAAPGVVPRAGPLGAGGPGLAAQRASAETLRVSAASSGEITLIATPVPSSKPAVVVAFGQMCACQW